MNERSFKYSASDGGGGESAAAGADPEATAREATRRGLALSAAILFMLGALTGGYVSAAMTGMVPADPRTALAAHVVALQGCFWLLGIAWSLRYARLGAGALTALVYLANSAAYGNWAVTAVKAWLRVAGVGPTGERTNDAVFGALTVLVVLPTFAAAAIWIWGLLRGGARARA